MPAIANAYRGHIVCGRIARPKAWITVHRSPRKGVSIRRFTLREDATLIEMRARKERFEDIAAVLGRAKSSVEHRFRLLASRP